MADHHPLQRGVAVVTMSPPTCAAAAAEWRSATEGPEQRAVTDRARSVDRRVRR